MQYIKQSYYYLSPVAKRADPSSEIDAPMPVTGRAGTMKAESYVASMLINFWRKGEATESRNSRERERE